MINKEFNYSLPGEYKEYYFSMNYGFEWRSEKKSTCKIKKYSIHTHFEIIISTRFIVFRDLKIVNLFYRKKKNTRLLHRSFNQ
jgi:hypothetical protein